MDKSMRIKNIALSLVATSLLSIPAFAEAEVGDLDVAGELNGNYGLFTRHGTTNNPQRYSDNSAKGHVAGEPYRSEVTGKLFLNQDIGDVTSWHSELQFNKDWSAIDGYDTTRINSQYDWLRELYVDTGFGDNLTLRLGKQQVVWGKSDGVKFLDIINPTDFRHWGQDSMEDSRIPLWMINAEYNLNDNGDSLQVVYVPQVNVTNQIPGLYNPETGDAGQPFVPLGMDTMLGEYNGFKNIGPQMGGVANVFFNAAPGAFGTALSNIVNTTVKDFTSMPATPPAFGNAPGNLVLAGVVGGVQTAAGKETNLYDPNYGGTAGTNYTNGNQIHMFDYMGDTTFATFDAFNNMQTKYVKKHARNDFKNGNIGARYSASTDGGLNYTLNYYYHYDNNPVIDVSWQGSHGEALTAVSSLEDGTHATVRLKKADQTNYDSNANGPATLVFTERQNKINTFGASFDYAIDNSFAPVILRSEVVYDKGTMQPVVDLGKLAVGDIVGAFQNKKADFLNYVVGLDITVLTNLFVSFQFMDKWNLDYIDEVSTQQGTSQTLGRFTANSATMSLGNQFQKAEEHQIRYTLYLSKPFLESDALRVNNLFLLENENGGYWDKLDFEYTYSDNVVLTGAYNQYGGDRNGVFGQFVDESNVQLGFKYIF